MSKIRLFGTSSGYVEIAPAAAASNNTLTAPSTVGEIIAKDAAGAIGVTSIVTTTATITTAKVGAAVTITESGIEASGIGITCANINGTQIGGRRNLIINGAMEIAQRGSSSTSDGYHTVDRIQKGEGGTDESVTQSHVDVSSGTPAYQDGFRKAFRLTNGNQTGGADAADYARMIYSVESQDLARSGWNYTSSSSFVSLSFWIKSSVAQNFYFIFNSADGTARSYVMETGSLTADTWTKIEKTFPGDSTLTFNNDIGIGCYLYIYAYLGTSYADNSVSVNAWKNVSNPQTPANTTTWWTTNDATLEMTGLQLEVGSQVTPFEHRSFTEELKLCQRYYQVGSSIGAGYGSANGYARAGSVYATQMRSTPTLSTTNSGSGSIIASGTSNTGFYVTYGSLGASSAGIFSFIAESEI